MSVTEKRFREGKGVQFLADGRIRCQAVSKAKLRKWREEYNDDDITPDDTWPETQCPKAAEEGYYVCKWHGGRSLRTVNPPKTILDTLPSELSAKLKIILDNPDYISRKQEILLIKARQWELLEKLEENVGGDEAWGMVAEGLRLIRKGKEIEGVYLIDDALSGVRNQREIWQEIYQSDQVLKDLTNTEVKTAKELRLMATNEQVMNMIASIYDIMLEKAEHYIEDDNQRDAYIRDISRDIRGLIKPSPAVLIESAR